MADPSIVFLMYHELEQPGRALRQSQPGYVRYVLKASEFKAQMASLKGHGWRGVSVGEAVQFVRDKTVAITFDDGSETDLLSAAPCLQEVGFRGTFYVTTSWVGRPGHLSGAQLRELDELGFEIGCHSMTHAYLTDLGESSLKREIAGAKADLEQLTGRPVEHFSCPGGRYDRRAARIAREAGYRTVATSQIRANSKATDPFHLARVAIMRSTTRAEFQEICEGQGLGQRSFATLLRAVGRKLLGNTLYDRLRTVALKE